MTNDNAAPRAHGAGGGSRSTERVVLEGYANDEDARRYARKTRKGPLRRLSAARERALLLRSLGGLPAGALVLDVPCGAGRLLPALAGRGWRTVGADLSGPMLQEARSAGRPLVRASAFALPFRAGAFDGVASVRLLHHYEREDRGRILAELARVADGRVAVTVFDETSFKHRRRTRREKKRRRRSLRFGVGLDAFRDEMREAGLRAVSTRYLLRGYAELVFLVADRSS